MALKMLDQPPKKIIAVDVVADRLEMARAYGATHGVNSKIRPDLMKVLMDITNGRGVDGALDTTGRPAVLKGLIHSAARKGKVVSVGVGDVSSGSPQLTMRDTDCAFSFQRKHHTIYLKWSTQVAATSDAVKETVFRPNFFRGCWQRIRREDSHSMT